MSSVMIRCERCGVGVPLGEYAIHLRKELKYKPWECGLCGVGFYARTDADAHFARYAPHSPHPHAPPDIAEAFHHAHERLINHALRRAAPIGKTDSPKSPFRLKRKCLSAAVKEKTQVEGAEAAAVVVLEKEPGDEWVDEAFDLQLLSSSNSLADAPDHESEEEPEKETGAGDMSANKAPLIDTEKASEYDKPQPVKCNLCIKGFQGIDAAQKNNMMRRHSQTHLSSPSLSCMLCNFESKSMKVTTIIGHIRTLHQLPKATAADGNFTDRRKELAAESHALFDICFSSIPSFAQSNQTKQSSQAATSVQEKLNTANLQCRKCQARIKASKESTRSHAWIHISEPKMSCQKCSFTSPNYAPIGQIKKHVKAVHGIEDGSGFVDKRDELAPLLEETTASCFGTSLQKTQAHYSTPIKLEDRQTDAERRCMDCGKCVRSKRLLHASTHLEMAFFSCRRCVYKSRAYADSQMRRHVASAHGDKPNSFSDHRKEPRIAGLLMEKIRICFPTDQGTL